MYFVDNPYRILRASVLASALIGTALTLPMSEALAQGGMSDMKKMPTTRSHSIMVRSPPSTGRQ